MACNTVAAACAAHGALSGPEQLVVRVQAAPSQTSTGTALSVPLMHMCRWNSAPSLATPSSASTTVVFNYGGIQLQLRGGCFLWFAAGEATGVHVQQRHPFNAAHAPC